MTERSDYRNQLIKRNNELMRYLAVLVERAGGEVLITPAELLKNRTLEKNDELLGGVRLKVT